MTPAELDALKARLRGHAATLARDNEALAARLAAVAAARAFVDRALAIVVDAVVVDLLSSAAKALDDALGEPSKPE